LDFWIFLNFLKLLGFFCWFFGISFKVTKVTTKSYQGYYWTPKIAKNWPKQHNKPKAEALCRSYKYARVAGRIF
jgi:hypothetical protein